MAESVLTESELKDIAQAQATHGPQPGEIFRHYKGGLYCVVARAVKEDTLEPLVIYRSNKYGTTWARTLANFSEEVEHQAIPGAVPRIEPRFRRVEG